MDSLLTGIIIIPGITGALFLLVITYLQHQLREPAYRIWEVAWGAYLIYIALLGVEVTVFPSAVVLFAARAFLIAMVITLLVSSRPVSELQQKPRLKPWRSHRRRSISLGWAVRPATQRTTRSRRSL